MPLALLKAKNSSGNSPELIPLIPRSLNQKTGYTLVINNDLSNMQVWKRKFRNIQRDWNIIRFIKSLVDICEVDFLKTDELILRMRVDYII